MEGKQLHTDDAMPALTPAAAPPELVEAAEATAARGIAAYSEFWTAASKDDRKLLADRHAALKSQAEAADKARTVEADEGFGEVQENPQ